MAKLRENRDPRPEYQWLATELAMLQWHVDRTSPARAEDERKEAHTHAKLVLSEVLAVVGALIEEDLSNGGAE